ncbi:MAG: hypothetical protein KAH54_00925 [Candidatus Sabulitectum sp.]|nr:hypothetical protein [Candidatus Sabulitectum sp.]
MRRITALLLLLAFTNIAVAHPFASGGGGTSSSEETDLTWIILGVVVVGVGALLITDILTDDSRDSQDALTGETEEPLTEETGVNWEQLSGNTEEDMLPLVAVSVFPGNNGRDLADYFSNLIAPGNNLYYTIYSSPVSFGQMDPAEAASTGFSFLDCQWFVTNDASGLKLYSEDATDPLWLFSSTVWDSLTIREASSSFLEFSMNSGE